MLFESNFFQILLLAFLIVLVFTVAYKFWAGVKTNEVDKAIQNLKISIFTTGFISLVLWFLLPTPAFSAFGPQSVSDIQSSEEILAYLQNYNKAITRTTQVVYFFIFIFVWGFLSSIHYLIKVVSKLRETASYSNTEESISA